MEARGGSARRVAGVAFSEDSVAESSNAAGPLDARHANEIISKVVHFIESNLQEGGVQDYEIEIVHL